MKRSVAFMILLAGAVLATALVSLAAPKFIHYQGYLTDGLGNPVPDTPDLTIRFAIYNDIGDSLWGETKTVSPHSGKFNVKLGEDNDFPKTLFYDEDRWLGIKVGIDAEMTPRTLLGSVPYAFMAGNVPDTSLDAKDKIKKKSIIDSLIADTTIGKKQIRHKSIIDSLIADTTIGKDKIKKKSIIDSLIADTTIGKKQIRKKSIIDSLIADTTIGKKQIRNKAIVDSLIDDTTVIGRHIRANAIGFGHIGQNDATPGQIMKWDGDSWEPANDDVGMTDNDWELIGNALYTNDEWGIARAGSILNGQHDSTHVNLGVACTTGYDVGDYKYITVSGGIGNKAEGEGSVIAGGGGIGPMGGNWITSDYCVIGGGSGNFAGDAAPGSGVPVCATIAGGRHNYATGFYSVVSGGGGETPPEGNIASGDHSAIGGGSGNQAPARIATVGGGEGNIANDDGATVGGGGLNWASATKATVAGGEGNHALSDYSVVGGGANNQAGEAPEGQSRYATVSGGGSNRALGTYSVIGGGGGEAETSGGNVADGDHSVVGGGAYNQAAGLFAVVAGGGSEGPGNGNTAWSDYSVVSGGASNIASGSFSTIGGGEVNSATGAWSMIDGGHSNQTLADYCVVGGGANNQAGNAPADQGHYATVGGGSYNQATGDFAVVAGGGGIPPGQGNVASGDYSSVGGGYQNDASGDRATIGGGQGNVAGGSFSTIPGGFDNSALAGFSFAAGNNATVQGGHSGTFVWSDNAGGFTSTGSNQFLIHAENGVGIMTDAPTEALDIDGNVRIRQMPSGTGNSVRIDGTGVLFQQSSSRRHKDNIRDLTINADAVLQLNPVSFQWKSTGDDDFGFIAEDVAELLPELVVYDSEDRPNGVKYDQLSVYLIGVAQQQQAAIDHLNKQVTGSAALEAQVSQLRAMVEALLAERNESSGGSDGLVMGK